MASGSDDERDHLEEEGRDVLRDLYERENSEGDTLSTSECRSQTSEDPSVTSDNEIEELEEIIREQPKPKVIVFDLGGCRSFYLFDACI